MAYTLAGLLVKFAEYRESPPAGLSFKRKLLGSENLVE
jgi:hypothetical protein